MKLHKIILVMAIAVITLLGDNMAAHGQLFGNGRFLKRLRGESVSPKPSASPTKAKAPKKSATPKKSAAPSKSATPEPTPAKSKFPTRSDAFYGNKKRADKNEIGTGTANTGTRRAPSMQVPDVATKSSRESTIGFGMFVEDVKGKLVVTDIDRKGNAAKKDIKKGDVLIGVGGVEITNLNEYNEITGILKDGDQIEMQFSRRGKEMDKKIVQLGESPKPAVAPGNIPKLDESIEPLSTPRAGMNSVLSNTRSREAANETIRRQQLRIEAMERELQRLKQMQTAPTKNSGGSVLELPSLSGPGL